MTGQPSLSSAFAVLMLVMSACCVTRLALGWRALRGVDRPTDTANALMGIAMAGMLLPPLRVLGPGGWQIVFLIAAAVFLGRVAVRRVACGSAGHDVPHVLACGAMLYMLATQQHGDGGQPPALSLLLAVALLACVVRAADRISMAPSGGPGGMLAFFGPRLAACCEITMGVTMGYMLITMS
jgi:hypothetical protein